MGLKFRRGSTAQQSGSLAFGEPYVNTTLGTLVVGGPSGDIVLSAGGTGSTGNFGAISGSGLDITGNANIAGNLTLGGQLQIGDQTTDTVNVVASLSSSLIPQTTAVFDLGSADKIWRHLYISTGSIKFVGAGGTVVGNLTNTGNGLNLDGGIVTNGNSSFGTSSLAITSVTGSLRITGSLRNGGEDLVATGQISHAEGLRARATGVASHAEGHNTHAHGEYSHAEGDSTSASGSSSHTEGGYTKATSTAEYAHAEGYATYVEAIAGHVEGSNTVVYAAARGGHAEGNQTKVYDEYGHSEGEFTNVYGGARGGHSEGWYSIVSGRHAHAEGSATIAQGTGSHAEGSGSWAEANYSHASGIGTKASAEGQSVTGKFNILDNTTSIFVIGDGTDDSNRSDVVRVETNNVQITGSLNVSGGITGSIALSSITAFSTYSTSVDSRITTEKGRIDAILSAADADKDTFAEIVTLINSVDLTNDTAFASFYTASVGRLGNLESKSASVDISVSNLNTYTGSNNTTNTTQNSRLTELENSASAALSTNNTQATSISNLNTTTASLNTSVSNLNTFSSSALTRLTNLEGTDITITLTGDVTGTGTITNLGNVSFATTVAANQVALGTDTTGDYVASLVQGTGVTITNNSGESATPTIAIGQAVATSSNVQFNSLGVGMAASATAGRIDATNDIVAYSSSDIRFKENIKAIENPIEKIRKISGNTYDWKAENKIEHGYEGNDVGVIAQEIEAVLPQLVQTRESGYKAVKYDKLVALLIEGIKEQQIQIDNLTVQVEELKKQKGL